MERIFFKAKNIYRQVTRSIAFFPIVISSCFMFLSLLMLNIESLSFFIKIKESISFLLITEIDTARTMLSTLIGGVFSLTVFSFSMVMLVLSQSSSNFSPRLLPGLISNKKNQVILGVYIGTLLYNLIVLMNVKSYEAIENSAGLSVFLGVFFGVSCTGLFVYFIHTISQDIQIQNIIDRIYFETLHELNSKLKIEDNKTNNANITFDGEIYYLRSNLAGYYKGFSKTLLQKSIENVDVNLEILPFKNSYIHENTAIVKYDKKLSPDILEKIHHSLLIEFNMHNKDDYFANMIKFTEVAVRAMSPGVNDPGTAINVINKLGLLVNKAFQIKETNYLMFNNNTLMFRETSYNEIINVIFQPLRQYSKQDRNVLHALITALNASYNNADIEINSKTFILKELKALAFDAKENIVNKSDLELLLKINNQ